MIKALGITEKSWVLYKKSTKLGLMRLQNDEYILIGESEFAGTYESIENLEKSLSDKIKFEQIEDKESEKSKVEDYPIKHSEAYDITLGEYPSYTKRPGSNDRYAAGYYGIKFKNGWQGGFCPRVTTLEAHEWKGPFKTKMEVDHTVKTENGKDK